MKFGLDVAQQQLEWDEIVSRVRFAEEMGFDGIWLFDHFKTMYGTPHGPCFEAYTVMAALATLTSRIRLGVLVTGNTYRHPSILASEAVTIDHISNGRVELAMGAAWFEEEHTELGIDFPPMKERAQRLEEAVQVMRKLMTEDETSFEGRYYRLENATYHPRPVQQPHIPIWIGARGEKLMLPVVARQADVWQSGGSADDLIRRSKLLDRYAEEAGRDPKSIKRAGSVSLDQSWDSAREHLTRLQEAGFEYVIAGWPGKGRGVIEDFANNVMRDLATA